MKFYSTALLVILFVPGLSDCQGCMETVDRETCKNAGLHLAAAKKDYEAASDAYTNAFFDLGLSSGQSPADLDDAGQRSYLIELNSEVDAKYRAYQTAHSSYYSLGCN